MNCATISVLKISPPFSSSTIYMLSNRFFFCLFLCSTIALVSLVHKSQAQKEIPQLWGHRVHDEAHVLSQGTIDNLEQRLRVFEDSTTNQMAILVIPSLNGEILEQYALRVANDEWKLGQKDKDNGVLLLVVINDRKVRIEAGQGLEGVLTDALSSRIIRNEIAPNFRRGDYDSGVSAAVSAIMLATKGEYKADDTPLGRRQGKGSLPITLILILIVIVLRFFTGNRRGGSGWSSGGGFFIGGGGSSWGGGGGGGFSGGGGSFGGGGSSGSW